MEEGGVKEHNEIHSMNVGHEMHEEHETHEGHATPGSAKTSKPHESHKGRHAGHTLEDFKKRFIISLAVTFPILILSPFIQETFGFRLEFPGSIYVLFLLSTFV